MKITRRTFVITTLIVLSLAGYQIYTKFFQSTPYKVGQVIDSFNGVKVYYNGEVSNTSGRNLAADNYNIGLKYQCVEFVKRYYYEHLNHRMPDSYGHAKDFFDKSIEDGNRNPKRDLIQYTNPGKSKPQVNDLVVFSATLFNQYGHVAIISKVSDTEIEIVQQNPGKYGTSRKVIALAGHKGKWQIDNDRIVGWLRKEAEK